MKTRPVVSIVVIGRDEGERLPRALLSARAAAAELTCEAEIIYVDSGSRDSSVDAALALGVRVVPLDREGASAARARNAGLRRARGAFVQLLDGDMEIVPGWLPNALAGITSTSATAVAGHLVERNPRASAWNLIMGMDWQRPAGAAETLGGAALWRRAVLQELGGFDETLRVGEDPDLCLRVRAHGGSFVVLDRAMATHDLDLRSFPAYLRRAAASGESRANVAWRHPGSAYARRRLREPLVHLAVAIAIVTVAILAGPTAMALAGAAFAALLLRRALLDRRAGAPAAAAAAHAVHVYAVKVPVAYGAARRLAALAIGAHR